MSQGFLEQFAEWATNDRLICPSKAMLNCSDLNRYMSRGVALNAPEVEEGSLLVSDEIGLGIEPDWDFLGDPVFEYKNIT